jgi:histidyl-tRNA synthetase
MELAGRSLKGQLKYADRIGARYVAIISDDAHASLKNMESGEQLEVERDALIAAVLRGERL